MLFRSKPGETLTLIASRYRISVDDLRRWNRIGRLAAGQKLTIQTRAAPAKGRPVGKAVKGKPRQASAGKPVKKSGS